MGSKTSTFGRLRFCARMITVWLIVASLAFTQVPLAYAEDAPVPESEASQTAEPQEQPDAHPQSDVLPEPDVPAVENVAPEPSGQPESVIPETAPDAVEGSVLEKDEAVAVPAEAVDEPRDDCVPGEVIVVLDDAGSPVARTFSDDGTIALDELDVNVIEEVAQASETSGTVVSAEIPAGKTVDEAVAELSNAPGVAYAQPNYLYRLIDDVEGGSPGNGASALSSENDASSRAVDDPRCNDSTRRGDNQYYLYQSKTVDAWNEARSDGKVTVAVLDTGCRLDHEDLQGTIDVVHAYDTFNDAPLSTLSGNGVVANGDVMGHGTHVCGIVGAQTGNGIGMAGASYNAKVLPVKVFNNGKTSTAATASTADIVEAYDYLSGLVDDGSLADLRVVNLSLGFYSEDTDVAFQSAIANMRTAHGVLTVCAGGNGNSDGTPRTDRSLPSDFDECLAVTSLDRDGGNTVWSDYNQYKDISAPGTDITSASYSSADGYEVKSGTSMAAPLVSGIAALVWAANPELTVDEVVAALENTADPVEDAENDRSSASGSHGAVDAKAAVESVMPTAQDASAYNLVLVVRFAGDTTGDGKTGFNADFRTSGVAETETEWDYLRAQFNGNAYVKYSLHDYLNSISSGKHNQVNVFPQTNEDGKTLTYITLPNDYSYYYGGASFGDSDGQLVSDAVRIFNEQHPSFDASRYDANKDGYLDNLLIIPTVAKAADENDPLWPHKANVGSWNLHLGKEGSSIDLDAYNIVDSQHLDMGTLAHEYLHTFGARDYYRQGIEGDPVGVWDIMGAADTPRSWPLAITRQTMGWTTLPERSQDGSYTLYAPGTDREQAFMFKSPLNDNEYFVVEYRKQGNKYDMEALDGHIGGSGLIVYRINPAYADVGNIRGEDYVYVFRPGETGLGDAYAGGRGLPNLVNAQVSTSAYATNLSRTSVGSADFSADITQGALCYSDGRNSGIVITPTAQSDDSITFTLAYPDYSQAGLWDAVESADGSGAAYDADVYDVQTVADGEDLYVSLDLFGSYQVARYDGSNWSDLGIAARGGVSTGQLAARDGVVYFLASNNETGHFVLRKYDGSAWCDVASLSYSANSGASQVAVGFVGDALYVLAGPHDTDAKLYRLEGASLQAVSDALPVGSIAHPALFELNGNPAVACGDSSFAKSYVFELIGSSWAQLSVLDEGSSNINSIARVGEKTYVYQYANNYTKGTSKLLAFAPDGTCIENVDVSVPITSVYEGSLSASGENLYLALLDGGSSGAAQVFTADAGNPEVWTQFGADVYKPATSLSSAIFGDKLVVSVAGTGNRPVSLYHKLPALPVDPGRHKAVFMADGVKVGEVSFSEGDADLTGVPAVPAKEGYSGTWADYALGSSDVIIEAVYTPNRYSITFVNWNGTPLLSGTYEYGSQVSAPVATRPGSGGVDYAFAGWSPAFSGRCDQARDMTYTAQFSERLLPNALTLQTNAHVQNKGWIGYRSNGAVVGTTGSSLRMESIRVRMGGPLASSDAISVEAHVQSIGWMTGLGNDQIAGTTGRSLRIEAMKLKLAPRLSLLGYRVYYRVHAQRVGWMGWAHDGAPAGTAGNSLRLEAIQIVLVAPGDMPPGNSYGGVRSSESHPYIDSSNMGATLSSALGYDGMVHVQSIGNVYAATNGASTLGTTGRSLRLEGLRLTCATPGVDLTYRTHVQNIGWQGWVGEGALSGTQGRSLRLEALQIQLAGAAAGSYDVYYRTHVQNIGWTGWARNGQQCGSAGYGYRMEAMQVMIIPKGGAAPGLCADSFYRR